MHNVFVITADRGDPDLMPHNVTFHQGLHLPKTKMIFREKKMQFYLEIVACDPLNFTMAHSKFIASIQKDEFINAFKSSADYFIQQQSLNYMYIIKSCKFCADVTH